MAGGVGYFYGQKLLAKLQGATDFTPPSTWYAALLTAAPTDAGGGTEVTGGAYVRQTLANNTTNFPAPASGPVSQPTGTVIDWGTATANWGTITHVAFYDASSAGNLGVWGPLSASKTVASGDSFKILAGNGTFTVV